jgi:hypothetical protein
MGLRKLYGQEACEWKGVMMGLKKYMANRPNHICSNLKESHMFRRAHDDFRKIKVFESLPERAHLLGRCRHRDYLK